MSDSAAMSARNGRHPAARVIDIDGDTEKVIYTYLGAVFKGVKKGAVFYVAPLGFDTVIHSKSTGTTTDSGAFGDAPLAYKGRTFGLTPSCLGFLKEMVAAGFKVQVKVKKIGMYSAGIPELVTMTADPQLLKQWWERQKNNNRARSLLRRERTTYKRGTIQGEDFRNQAKPNRNRAP